MTSTDTTPAVNFGQLVDPITGLVATYDDPASCADLLNELGKHAQRIRYLQGLLNTRLVQEARERGENTYQAGAYEVTVENDYDLAWDDAVLHQLVDVGLVDADRYASFTRHEFKVDAREAAKVAKLSERHNRIVEQAKTRHIKRQRAKVRRKTNAAAPVAPVSVQAQARELATAERDAEARGV